MARLSFKDAVEWLTANGYEFGDKKDLNFRYYIKKDEEETLFENGTKIVQFVRGQMGQGTEVFNKEQAEQELQNLEKELKKYEDMQIATKDKYLSQRYFREQEKLKKKIEEQKVYIEAEGNLLTPNRLRQVLKDAGLENKETFTTAVKGWHEYSGDFSVEVYWKDRRYLDVTPVFYRHMTEVANNRKRDKIVKAIEEAGYSVVENNYNQVLVDRFLK